MHANDEKKRLAGGGGRVGLTSSLCVNAILRAKKKNKIRDRVKSEKKGKKGKREKGKKGNRRWFWKGV